jgi:hypothetical protein
MVRHSMSMIKKKQIKITAVIFHPSDWQKSKSLIINFVSICENTHFHACTGKTEFDKVYENHKWIYVWPSNFSTLIYMLEIIYIEIIFCFTLWEQ